MTTEDLKNRIKRLVPNVYKEQVKAEINSYEFLELTKFPELKKVIVDLLTTDFDNFLSSIDWVSPRPTTFRINLKNGRDFYLIYNGHQWTAEVEGKKYYLLNLPEEERGALAISRILRYGAKDETTDSEDSESDDENFEFDGSDTEDDTEDVEV